MCVCVCAARHTSHWGAVLRCHLFHGAPDLTPIGAARSWKLVAHRAARGPSPRPRGPRRLDTNRFQFNMDHRFAPLAARTTAHASPLRCRWRSSGVGVDSAERIIRPWTPLHREALGGAFRGPALHHRQLHRAAEGASSLVLAATTLSIRRPVIAHAVATSLADFGDGMAARYGRWRGVFMCCGQVVGADSG